MWPLYSSSVVPKWFEELWNTLPYTLCQICLRVVEYQLRCFYSPPFQIQNLSIMSLYRCLKDFFSMLFALLLLCQFYCAEFNLYSNILLKVQIFLSVLPKTGLTFKCKTYLQNNPFVWIRAVMWEKKKSCIIHNFLFFYLIKFCAHFLMHKSFLGYYTVIALLVKVFALLIIFPGHFSLCEINMLAKQWPLVSYAMSLRSFKNSNLQWSSSLKNFFAFQFFSCCHQSIGIDWFCVVCHICILICWLNYFN